MLLLLPVSFLTAGSNAGITAGLDSIIRNELPDGTDISLYVWDLTADSAIYAYRENVLNRPASTLKVLTAYTAVGSLGADYCFRTTVKADGVVGSDSVLTGNLYIVGGLDPQLMEEDLRHLAAGVRECGIKRVKGNVIADISIMDSIYWGSGWAWDDTPNSYQPYVSPLMVNGGYVTVYVRPGSRGGAPKVTVVPQISSQKIRNEARTGVEYLGPVSIRRDWLHNDNTIIVSGNSSKATSAELNVFDSSDFTFTLFRDCLDKAGIVYDGYKWGECPASTISLTSVAHSLKSVLRETLKESINLNAEAMMLQAARAENGGKVDFNSAAKYEETYIKRTLKTGKRPFMIVDGSGLSMYDNIPASLFVDVLRQIYGNPALFELFYDSLPIAGYDGTLKGRMGTKPTAGTVHAKTGTVTGACTLTGYARTSDGRDLAFCIMNSGATKMAPSRRVQDAICQILCR